ncbi:hypothetical protein FSP39_013996 [Pinctada imbricata]|uniref:Uncharacterized protein n=1 Tax=Pinctada imbricata TaxID=66713 RepID=A0AA88Y3Q9_PINIB|nr:hypothetical protein FSP39_013996 [Pinctada imbricata]
MLRRRHNNVVVEESSLVEPMTRFDENIRQASAPKTPPMTKAKTRIGPGSPESFTRLPIWTTPDGRTENQTDHLTIGRKLRRSLCGVRVKRRADAAFDHHLVVAVIKTKLKACNDHVEKSSYKYNVHSLKERKEAD